MAGKGVVALTGATGFVGGALMALAVSASEPTLAQNQAEDLGTVVFTASRRETELRYLVHENAVVRQSPPHRLEKPHLRLE